jgi:hypothetical protein
MKVFVRDLQIAVGSIDPETISDADVAREEAKKFGVDVVEVEDINHQLVVTIFGEELNVRALLEEWEYKQEDGNFWIRENDELKFHDFPYPS